MLTRNTVSKCKHKLRHRLSLSARASCLGAHGEEVRGAQCLGEWLRRCGVPGGVAEEALEHHEAQDKMESTNDGP